jgi:hypothetical protein
MGPQAFFLVPPFDVSDGCRFLPTRFAGDPASVEETVRPVVRF